MTKEQISMFAHIAGEIASQLDAARAGPISDPYAFRIAMAKAAGKADALRSGLEAVRAGMEAVAGAAA